MIQPGPVEEAWEIVLRNTRRAGIVEERRRWIFCSIVFAMVIGLYLAFRFA